jgi:hypothetical protein
MGSDYTGIYEVPLTPSPSWPPRCDWMFGIVNSLSDSLAVFVDADNIAQFRLQLIRPDGGGIANAPLPFVCSNKRCI